MTSFLSIIKHLDYQGPDKHDYVSMTVWDNKDNFDAWRVGDAFKEAHGGGGLSGFIGKVWVGW